MKSKKVSALFASILFVILVLSVLQGVNAQMGHYYIRSDGSVDPSNLPIERNGDVYTLTADLNVPNAGIIIQKSNVVLDGAGHKLNGSNVKDSAGILISGNDHVTVKNLVVENFYYGFYVTESNNDVFRANTVEKNFNGFYIYHKCNSTSIEGNIVQNNKNTGVWVRGADYYSQIISNTIVDNHIGLALSGSTLTTAYHNNFVNNGAHVVLDMAYGNKWDNGSPGSGNYWDTYNGTDANNDGSGDSAFKVTQYYTDKDNNPLMKEFTIPEYPSLLIVVLLCALATIMVLIQKKKQLKNYPLHFF